MTHKRISIDLRMIDHTGIGTYIQSLIGLILLNNETVEYFLLIDNKINYLKYLDPVHLENVNLITIYSPIYSLREQIEIPMKLPRNINLYWSPHYNIPILIRSKILVTIHDIYHVIDKSRNNYLRKLYAIIMFKIIKYRLVPIITVSKFSKRELVNKLDFNKETINIIYNGISDTWKSTKNYKKNNQILYVGNFKKHKNIEILIDAFIKLKNNGLYKLVLIGGDIDSLSTSSRFKVDRFNNISCYAPVERSELVKYYNNSRLLVFPSLYEGFGLPPLEAISCKCPILLSDIPPLREIYKDIAYYFNPYDVNDLSNKLKFLLDSPDCTDKLLNRSRRITDKYSWVNAMEKTVNLINRELSL